MSVPRHAYRVKLSAAKLEITSFRSSHSCPTLRPTPRQLWTTALRPRSAKSGLACARPACIPSRHRRRGYATTGQEASEETQAKSKAKHQDTQEGNDAFSQSETYFGGENPESSTSDDMETLARVARQTFGDQLPEGLLQGEAYKVYERLYGRPDFIDSSGRTEHGNGQNEIDRVALLQGEDGSLEEIEYDDGASDPEPFADELDDTFESDELIAEERNEIDEEDTSDENQDFLSSDEGDSEDDILRGEQLRAHPFTLAGRAGTKPSTIYLPKSVLTGPTASLLQSLPNKHLRETAENVFGGQGLPYSTSSPHVRQLKLNKPIQLDAYQSKMTSMEADVFFAVLAPGLYASSMSILVELRRRLGNTWLTGLMGKYGGPSILDAGAGGAAVLAWRELLKAEWARINDDAPEQQDKTPLGKATVLANSPTLQERSMKFLDNTTFLPRLPDYIHVQQEENSQRKQFDIIVASHGLWPLSEDWMRKQHVENLWRMLNPKGGILILLEKGVSRGFEVIAGARKMMLENDFFTPTANRTESTGANYAGGSGAILAPCTTHSRCPLYMHEGISNQRKDFCHFKQRYIRPTYLQNILGSKDRNHEDVPFSYIAVQRGVSPEEIRSIGAGSNDTSGRKIVFGEEAADRAFEGYDIADPDLRPAGQKGIETPVTARIRGQDERSTETNRALITPRPDAYPPPSPFSLPRVLFPPLKRHGHVLIDVCTPAGKFERWTVPRSYGKQAYRDARKASWGDLWPLGAKLRVPRKVRQGRGHVEAESNTGGLSTKRRKGEKTFVDDGLRRPSKKAKLKEKRLRRARTMQE